MTPERSRLEHLFQKYFDKTASADERMELAQLMEDPANKAAVMHLFHRSWEDYSGDGEIVTPGVAEAMLGQILGSRADAARREDIGRTGDATDREFTPRAPVKRMPFRRVAVAAAILFVIAGGVWLWGRMDRPAKQVPAIAQVPSNVAPGRNGAILTLDNGRQVVLDSLHNGLIAQQGSATVTKQKDRLVYKSAPAAGDAMSYNTITTPRGRQYSDLVLADGTRVWLDAGSSIRFPVAFIGRERRVEVTGQVWFDVVHNERQPFRVVARGVEIDDVGTQFNVNAYEDEERTKVTLVEGAVSIGDVLLKPGQQAQVPITGKIHVSDHADLDQVMAWKNGFFSFRDADIKAVMRELARWYDIDVVYEGTHYTETFSGKIGRRLSLRDLLDGLAQTRVRYRIEGKKLVIL
jgi:ferric-dicitrate binding protein FerR (iron transport regulator)